jgi:hypothetical protein
MMSHPVEHIRTIPTAGHSFSAPLPRRPMDGLEEAPGPSHARVAARPGAISTKAMLVSLFGLSAVAAGALFLMHSLVVSDPSGSQRLGVAELQATAAPMAIPPPISLTPHPCPGASPLEPHLDPHAKRNPRAAPDRPRRPIFSTAAKAASPIASVSVPRAYSADGHPDSKGAFSPAPA